MANRRRPSFAGDAPSRPRGDAAERRRRDARAHVAVERHTGSVTLTIDGITVTAPKGALIIRVCEQMGIEIPLMSLTASLSISEISKRLTGILRSQDKVLMSGQMSVLAQEHVEIPAALSEAEVAATAAVVARRAKSVGRIL